MNPDRRHVHSHSNHSNHVGLSQQGGYKLSLPTHNVTAGIHRLEWSDEAIMIRVDRIREDSRYNVAGEVLVHKLDAVAPHVLQDRATLTGPRSKIDLAKRCEARYPDIAWHDIIEQTCVLVLNKFREGEPAVDLASVPKREGLQYRVKPLLFEGQPNIIFGHGGLGKSMFAAYLATLVASNQSPAPLTTEPGPVLYLDYEADRDEARDRVEMISNGLGVERPSIIYRFCHQPLASETEALQRIIAEHGIALAVIDSGGPACGGQPESADNTIGYFSALRSLRVTTLTVAHISKNGPQSAGPFGSVYWTNLARSVWQVRKSQQAGSGRLDIALYHKKVNSGMLQKPLSYRFEFKHNSVDVRPQTIQPSTELAAGLPLFKRIELALQKGARSELEVADICNEGVAAVQARLVEREGSAFIRLDSGKWGLLGG